MSHSRLALALGLGLLVVSVGPRAQTSGQRPQFRSDVNLVQVDVSVLDRDRLPIRDLAADDFTILEDGVPQQIANFAFIDTPEREWSDAEWPDDVVSNVPSGFVGDGRLIVIFMDDTTIWLPRSYTTAIGVARAIIGQLGPTDLAAVVFASGSPGADYTNDRARLLSAASTFTRRITGNTLRRLVLTTEDLAAVPDRRKILFYVGVGFPFNTRYLAPTLDTFGQVLRGQMEAVMHEMQSIFLAAQTANVNIYAIDPSGLQAPTEGVYDTNRDNRDFLQIIAGETGGRAIVNLNEPSTQVPRIFRENRAYYLLGFQSSNQVLDGKFRRLEVKVDRRRTDVRARKGYFAVPPKRFELAGPRERARRAMESLMTVPDLPLTLGVAPFAVGRDEEAAVTIALALAPPAAAGTGTDTVDVTFSIFDEYGRPRESIDRSVVIDLEAGADGSRPYQVLWRVDLKPGQYQVSADAQSRRQQAGGSVVASFSVPAFRDERVSLSGIVVSTSSPPPSAPAEAFDGILPSVPTLVRTFGPGDEAAAWFRVYQGRRERPQPVTLTLRVVRDEQPVAEVADELAVDRFDRDGAADYQFSLPLTGLTSGTYAFRVEARLPDGSVARRDLAFRVR